MTRRKFVGIVCFLLAILLSCKIYFLYTEDFFKVGIYLLLIVVFVITGYGLVFPHNIFPIKVDYAYNLNQVLDIFIKNFVIVIIISSTFISMLYLLMYAYSILERSKNWPIDYDYVLFSIICIIINYRLMKKDILK